MILLLKAKLYSLIKMKKKSDINTGDAELNRFKDMALQLLANKVFTDFITIGQKMNAEPEHFYEEWLKRCVFKPDDDIRIWTWRYFIINLIEYRKFQKQ